MTVKSRRRRRIFRWCSILSTASWKTNWQTQWPLDLLLREFSFKTDVTGQVLFFCSSLFAMSSFITSLRLIEDRRSGIWNRTLSAGGTPLQFLISHLVCGSATMIIQAVEFIIYASFVGNDGHTLKFILSVSLLICLLGFSGTLFGLCISVFTDSVLVATYISLMLTLPLLSLSGEKKGLKEYERVKMLEERVGDFWWTISGKRIKENNIQEKSLTWEKLQNKIKTNALECELGGGQCMENRGDTQFKKLKVSEASNWKIKPQQKHKNVLSELFRRFDWIILVIEKNSKKRSEDNWKQFW